MATANELMFRTDNPAKWGNGKGANLTPGEVDANFFALASAIDAVELPAADVIAAIEVSATDNTMMIITSSGAKFGPLKLPVASLKYRGAFVPFESYAYLDLITAADGLYLVREPHIAEGIFNPARDVYQRVMPMPTGCDIGFFYPGLIGVGLAEGDTMFAHVVARPFYIPQNGVGSIGKLEVAAAEPMELELFRNSTRVGLIRISAGAAAATFSIDQNQQFVAGDVLRVPRPQVIDTAARSLMLTIACRLGVA